MCEPVLVEVGIDGGNGGVFDVERRGEVGEALGEVDGVASLSKVRELLNGGRCKLLCRARQFPFHCYFLSSFASRLIFVIIMHICVGWNPLLKRTHCPILIN